MLPKISLSYFIIYAFWIRHFRRLQSREIFFHSGITKSFINFKLKPLGEDCLDDRKEMTERDYVRWPNYIAETCKMTKFARTVNLNGWVWPKSRFTVLLICYPPNLRAGYWKYSEILFLGTFQDQLKWLNLIWELKKSTGLLRTGYNRPWKFVDCI